VIEVGSSAFIDLETKVTPRNNQPYEDFLHQLSQEELLKESKDQVLTHNQESLLSNIGRFPCIDRKERQMKLHWHPQTMQNTIETLSKCEFIAPVQLKKGGPGSSFVTYQLTKKAKAYMLKRQIHFEKLHGSIEHHCVIEQWVSAKKEAGFKVRRQVPVGEYVLDAMTMTPEKIGLEVVASDNLKTDLIRFPEELKIVNQLEVIILNNLLFKEYSRDLKKKLPAELFKRIILREF